MKLGNIICLALVIFSCGDDLRHHDLLIRNGVIHDGRGLPGVPLDLAIDGDRITALGDLSNAHTAERTIDATGLVVTPGFIDVHTHLDPILRMPDAESHVRQGVTLALGGPDGSCPWPLDAHLDTLQHLELGMNIAYLAGHNTIRRQVMGLEDRAPSSDELDSMKYLVKLAMEQGAFGLSTGLKYLPGAFSDIDEVIALSRVARSYRGFYTSHLREEGLGLLEAVQEAIQISAGADIPVVLTHHKAIGQPMWGKSRQTLAMVDSARDLGLDIRMDQYPYIASYTGISVLIPAWARAGGQDAFLDRLRVPMLRDSIRRGIIFNILNDRGGGDLDRILLARVSWQPDLEGQTLGDWAVREGLETSPENGAELVIRAQEAGGASCVYFAMHDEDVDRIMQHPMTMVASDGRLTRPGSGHPHPRWYGTFPRVLGHYVRDRRLLDLHEAIRKMTSAPAKLLGLKDRGVLRPGAFADVVIFDADSIRDNATFQDPHQYSTGIHYVLVNGRITVDESQFTAARGGRVVYGPAYRKKGN